MKKRKILYLFPLAALVLSGCSLQEGWDLVKDFSVNKVYEPVRDFFLNLFGVETPKKEDKKEEGGGGHEGEGGGEGEVSKYGTEAKPLSVSEAIALISSEDPTLEAMYVTGEIITNGAWSTQYEQIDFTISDGEKNLKVFRAVAFPEGFKASEVTANSMKGMTLVASGIGMTYGETYEVASDAENGIMCTVLSFAGEAEQQGHVDNYGTAEHPLTVSEAIEVIKIQDPTQQPIYVTGEVSGNGDWYSSKSNIDIYLTDGENTIQMFRADKFPEGMDLSSVKKNDLIGKIVVGKGTGTYYVDGKKYELDQGCEVISMIDPVIDVESVTVTSGDEVVKGYTLNLTAQVLPQNASQDVVWTIESGSEFATLEGNVLTGVAAGEVVVRATAAGTEVYGEKTVTVIEPQKVYVESIIPNPTSIEMTMGDNPVQLTYQVLPTNVQEAIDLSVSPEGVVEFSATDSSIVAVAPGEATIRIEGADSHVGVDVPVKVNKKVTAIADVYAAALSGDETNEYTFQGVVTAMQGNSFYLQENGYGMLVYNYAITDIAVGKLVQVTSKVTVYKGLVETKSGTTSDGVILGDGQLPDPIEIGKLADIGEANILANAHSAEFVSKDAAWSSSRASLAVFKIGNDNITVKFDKYGFDADKGALLNNAQAGAKFNLLNIVTAINTDQEQSKQLGFAGTSTIEGIFDDPTAVEITSKNEIAIDEVLTLAATVTPATASQEVDWAITSGAEFATLAEGKLTGVKAGKVTVKATAKGFENVFATQEITVKDESAPTPEHAGTEADPYTVSDAKLLFDGLADGENTAECFVTGTIVAEPAPTLSGTRYRFYLSDGVCTTNLYAYNVDPMTGTTAHLANIPYGSVVVAKGAIKNFGGTFELCYISGGVASCVLMSVEKPALSSVVVSGTASQTEYGVDAAYNHNGLVATANFASGAAIDVSDIATWSIDPATASLGDTSISVTATYENVVSAAFNVSVTVSSGTVLTETEIYKLDGTVTGGTSGYAEASNITQNGLAWAVTANTTMNPWRFVGKGAQVRTCESKAAVSSDDITKVIVNTGSATATVNSITLKVGTSQGAGDVSEITLSENLVSAALEFARPAGASWAGRYFTIVFDVTCAAGSNQYIQLTSAQFFAMK